MRIQTADQQASVINGGGYRTWLANIVMARHGHQIDWSAITDAPPLIAKINHGDWIAQCDLLQDTDFPCNGSVVVTFTDPLFFCDNCCNVEYQNKLRMVQFPDETNRLIIEELLTNRPHPSLRNYNKHDTIATLQDENKRLPWTKKKEDKS